MRRNHWLAIGCAALTMQGCATLSENECLVSDWQAIGYEDGVRGLSSAQFGKHRKACAKHGVAASLEEYQEGWKDGLRVFCQPENGFNVGARGGGYGGACPDDLEAEFANAYRSGRHLHQLQSGVNSARNQIVAKQNALEKTAQEIDEKEALLIASDTPVEERVILLMDIRELAARQNSLQSEIVELEREKAVREDRLDDYRSSLYFEY